MLRFLKRERSKRMLLSLAVGWALGGVSWSRWWWLMVVIGVALYVCRVYLFDEQGNRIVR